ncbi:hypothetical protein M409DRAFT_30222 [Zasmidium cellare ATCC 36951]|uniref:Uncharacterized protein n=1 Tax=Zasmidium cellare ATCC 36951 TaxID=1080233 RepID=A0A6A6BXB2_ZASCE|nr:uncharacterized protein M409DRAFT_30222 [Zasmidium cellare ATCC 36951]KAF2159345.1 hypothetical protein M409DRAFT_30222 [Zasmidium cellare ATCC 36951]
MLDIFREAPLLASPDGLRGGHFIALDARKYKQPSAIQTYDLATTFLSNGEVEDWAIQKGRFAPPSPPLNADEELEGGLRMLFAQPQSSFRSTIPEVLTKSTVLDALNLPASTIASLQLAGGTFSVHTIPEGSQVDECERLSIVFRSPQKWECTVGGLAMSHDFKTGVTTALNIGYAFDLNQCVDSSSSLPDALTKFISRVEKCQSLWPHPLFLPNLFRVQHVLRVSNFIMQDLDRQVIRLEYCVGVTKAGRSNKPHLDFPEDEDLAERQKLYIGDQLQRDNARRLMEDINDLTTKLEFTKMSASWDQHFAVFVLELLADSRRLADYRGISAAAFRETLEYVRNYSQSLCDVVQSHHARMQLQLNITLLGMDMFSWRFGQDNRVAKDFWVYWAVAIPLTIVTLSGWALWWRIEKRRFELDVQKAAQQQRKSSKWQRDGMVDGLKSHVVGIGGK